MSSDNEKEQDDSFQTNKKGKYRKEKPWDNEEIDHWKVEEWKPEFMSGPLLEESSFAVLFPEYRENYLRQNWSEVNSILKVSFSCSILYLLLMETFFSSFF